MRSKLKRFLPYFLSFFIPILIFLCTFLILPLFGVTRSVLYQDPNVEFVDFLAYFKGLLNGSEDFFYSFNLGGGSGMIALTAFYLLSPFNLIVALFPNHLLGYAFFVIVLLEIGTAGLTSYYYFRKEHAKLGAYKPLIFALGYALSAYMVGYFEHFEWLDSVVLLPLVCLGINKIVRNEKPWLYLITLTSSIITCYYSGFMICILSVLWLTYKLITKETDSSAKQAVRNFALSSLLAGLMGALLIVPTFFSMFSGSTDRLTSEVLTFGNKFPIDQLFLQLTSNQEYYYPLIFGGMIVTILTILYFTNRKINNKEKLASLVMLFILVISMNVTILCAIWHLGSIERGAPYRFTFIVTFFMLSLAAKALEHSSGIDKKYSILALTIFVLIYILKLPEELNSVHNSLFFLDLLIIICGAFLLFKPSPRTAPLVVLQVVSLSGFTLSMLVLLGKWELGVSSFDTTKTAIYDTAEIVQQTKDYAPDDEFHRIEKTFMRSSNDGLQHGYSGLSCYTSTAVPTIKNTFVGFTPFALNSVYDTANNGEITTGDTPPLSSISLSGVRYILAPNEGSLDPKYFNEIARTEHYVAYEYNLHLPLGFVVSEASAKIEDEQPTYLINKIAESELNNTKIFTDLDDDNIDKKLENATQSATSYTKQNYSEDGVIIYKIHNPTKSPIYYSYDFKRPAGSHSVAISEILKKNPETGEFAHLSHLNGTLNLGDEEDIEFIIKFFPNNIMLYNENFYTENQAAAESLIQALKAQDSKWKKLSGHELEGAVNVEKDNQELVLSLQYDKSWRVEVDGQEVKAEPAFGNLLGIKLSKGKHIIKMTYAPQGWSLGVTLSLIGASGAIVWYIIDRKKSHV